MESMEQALIGTPNYGSKATYKVARNGDLVGATYLEATLNSGSSGNNDGVYVPRPGFAMIKNVELRIGGQAVDTQSGVWMDVWLN